MAKIALAQPLAWSIAALSLTLATAGLALNILAQFQGYGDEWLGVHILFGPTTAAAYALVGGFQQQFHLSGQARVFHLNALSLRDVLNHGHRRGHPSVLIPHRAPGDDEHPVILAIAR